MLIFLIVLLVLSGILTGLNVNIENLALPEKPSMKNNKDVYGMIFVIILCTISMTSVLMTANNMI